MLKTLDSQSFGLSRDLINVCFAYREKGNLTALSIASRRMEMVTIWLEVKLYEIKGSRVVRSGERRWEQGISRSS